jgi:hypothetical protein
MNMTWKKEKRSYTVGVRLDKADYIYISRIAKKSKSRPAHVAWILIKSAIIQSQGKVAEAPEGKNAFR